MNLGRTDWQDRRYRIGVGAGCISVRDVILLGFIFVSPGRRMPLLQLRPDFGEHCSELPQFIAAQSDGEIALSVFAP